MRAKVDAARRFDPPFTATPNILFDWWMANLPNPEFLCLLYVYRRTYGFRRAADNISIDQFVHGIKRDDGTVLDTGTGLARSTVIKSLKALIEKGLIAKSTRHKVNGADAPSTYIVTKKITQNPITKGEGPGNGRYEGPGNGPTKEALQETQWVGEAGSRSKPPQWK